MVQHDAKGMFPEVGGGSSNNVDAAAAMPTHVQRSACAAAICPAQHCGFCCCYSPSSLYRCCVVLLCPCPCQRPLSFVSLLPLQLFSAGPPWLHWLLLPRLLQPCQHPALL
jgi:hypothetical protein